MVENHKKKIELRIFDEAGYALLQDSLLEMEKLVQKQFLGEILFSALSEIISNAAKANMKRAYFDAHGYNPDNPNSYREGIESFKTVYPNLHNVDEYREALKRLDLLVSVEIDLNEDRLLIHVENNTLLLAEEERRIRENLAGAMSSGDILQFSVSYGDETEGAGLGLAMVIQLVRHLGFNPANFRVFTKGERTIARLDLPLNKDYTPIRERTDPAPESPE